MTDDERIARLTELARRVWPDLADNIPPIDGEPGHWVRVHGKWGELARLHHPRALDALEAALRVLAGEPNTEYVRGRVDALTELQRACVAHGGVYDAETNTVIDADELERRILAEP